MMDEKDGVQEALEEEETKAADSPSMCPMAEKCKPPTYEQARAGTLFFLDQARCSISLGFDDLMIIITIFVLFGDDVKLASIGGKSSDGSMDVLMLISLLFFILELVLNCFAKTAYDCKRCGVHGYLNSFYFWLDALAIISMFPDIAVFREGIPALQALSSTGAADVGAVGKLGRVARMVRLVRLVKLYKTAANRQKTKEREAELLAKAKAGEISVEEYTEKLQNQHLEKESKVGTELSEQTIKRVITIVLAMLVGVPLLSNDVNDPSFENALRYIQVANEAGSASGISTAVGHIQQPFPYGFGSKTPDFDSAAGPLLIYLELQPYYPLLEQATFPCGKGESINSLKKDIDNQTKVSVCVDKQMYMDKYLREGEMKKYKWPSTSCRRYNSFNSTGGEASYTVETGCAVTAWFSLKPKVQEAAIYNILTTLFVAFVLLSGATILSGDADKYVLEPIQSMVDLVERVAEDPMGDLGLENKEGGSEFETRLIEGAIEKITSLLRVGFGIAGSEIIKENLSSKEDLDLMAGGKRIYAVFGFCDIHEFDHMTDVLKGDIMKFVNDVAVVVHENVTTWGGKCNKNLGNSFLMLWKVPYHLTGGSTNVDVTRINYIRTLADKALIGYCKVIIDLNRNAGVLAYREKEECYHQGHPFVVRMGFGLHVGWGIEGAVGSLQKVDATYLSPNVNMTARLETASKQFGVPLLCSEIFYKCLSEKAQTKVRRLDKVMVKGSVQSIDLYTYNADQERKFPMKRAHADELKLANSYDPDHKNEVWDEDEDLLALGEHFDSECWKEHTAGIDSYLRGQWAEARDHLQAVNDNLVKRGFEGGDGPSNTVLNYIGRRNFQSPPDWDEKVGRALTSK